MTRNLALILLFGVFAFSQKVVKAHSSRYYVLKSMLLNDQQDLKFVNHQQHNVMQFPNNKIQHCVCSLKKSTCFKRESLKNLKANII